MSYNAKIYRKQGGDELVIDGGVISKAGVQANAVTALSTSANGTEIAAAVNAIINALIGVGILKEAE